MPTVEMTSTSYTIHLEMGVDGEVEEIFPCRCGETHRGNYGFYDWMHHNCFHKELFTEDSMGVSQTLCGNCGEVFHHELKGG